MRRFNTVIVEKLQTELISQGLKNANINKVLNVLKHMMRKAVEWEMADEEINGRHEGYRTPDLYRVKALSNRNTYHISLTL